MLLYLSISLHFKKAILYVHIRALILFCFGILCISKYKPAGAPGPAGSLYGPEGHARADAKAGSLSGHGAMAEKKCANTRWHVSIYISMQVHIIYIYTYIHLSLFVPIYIYHIYISCHLPFTYLLMICIYVYIYMLLYKIIYIYTYIYICMYMRFNNPVAICACTDHISCGDAGLTKAYDPRNIPSFW
jgi:hypothetical protein